VRNAIFKTNRFHTIKADKTIDYTMMKLACEVRDIDLVINAVGGLDKGRVLLTLQHGGAKRVTDIANSSPDTRDVLKERSFDAPPDRPLQGGTSRIALDQMESPLRQSGLDLADRRHDR
jgi:hypothetical protein